MSRPLVSVITPCYNAEKYIREMLISLLEQTYENIEIIIVNDGSTDNSEKIIKTFNDNRIQYYYQQNKGQCAALNYGFSKSSGDYIKFYDADDVLDKNVIEGQVDSLKSSDYKDISFIEWRRFYNNILPEQIDHSDQHTIHRDCTPLEFLTYTGNMPMVQCGFWLIPRGLLLKSGLWDERLSLINDTEFFTRLLPYAGCLRFSIEGFTYYRSNHNSNTLSADFSEKGIKSALLSIDLMADWMLKTENSARIKKIIANSYTMILEWAYPKHINLSKTIEERLKAFPKKYVQHSKSGNIYNVLLKIVGWKPAVHLSKIYYRLRYNKH